MTKPAQIDFHLGFWNCENLFVRLENLRAEDLDSLTEGQWQALTKSKEPNKPLKKVRWSARTIQNMNLDLLALAEIGGRESLDNLNRHFLNNEYWPLMIEGNSERGIDVGFLLNRRRLEKIELISHRLRPLGFTYPVERPLEEGGKSHLFSRDCLELRLFSKNERTPRLIVFVVHLKSKLDPQGFDPAGFLRRQAEARTAIKICNEVQSQFPSAKICLVGDFNAQGRREVCDKELIEIYERTDLVEIMDICAKPSSETSSQITFPKGFKPVGVQIDHIFITPNLISSLIKESCRIELFTTELGQPIPYVKSLEQRQALPSDHYPICASFSGLFQPPAT